MTSVDCANRLLSHYIEYMQPQSSLLQLAATAVPAHAYRQSLQSGHDAARVYELCLFDACGEYGALFVSTASGFKGLVAPKCRNQFFSCMHGSIDGFVFCWCFGLRRKHAGLRRKHAGLRRKHASNQWTFSGPLIVLDA